MTDIIRFLFMLVALAFAGRLYWEILEILFPNLTRKQKWDLLFNSAGLIGLLVLAWKWGS